MPDDTTPRLIGASVFNDPRCATLAQVMNALPALLGDRTRELSDLLSSCRRAAMLIGQDPALIPAHARYIRDGLKKVHLESQGISRKRLLNIRRDVLRAFEIVGICPSWSYLRPLSPSWQALWKQIGYREQRWRLSRPFRMFSGLGIEPANVRPAHWAQFQRALTEERILDEPRRTYRNATKAWDALVALMPELPPHPISEPRKRRGYTFPEGAFLISFQNDLDAWLSNLRPEDIFSPRGIRRPLAERTVSFMRFRMLQFASAVVLSGHKRIDEIRCLADIATLDAYKSGLRWMHQRLGRTESNLRLAMMVCSMVRYHLAPPDLPEDADLTNQRRYDEELARHNRHVKQLTDLSGHVGEKQRGLSERTERRLLQFDDPKNVDTFLLLPEKFAKAAQGHLGSDPVRAAILMQAAVMCEILQMCPVRRRNLVELTMTRSIVRNRTGDGAVHLIVSQGSVKNKQDLVFDVPAESIRLIDEYIARWRPTLIEKPSDWLIPGRGNGHKHKDYVSRQLFDLIFQLSGLEINVHLFRSITIEIYADEFPEDVETPTQVLGHRDPNSIRFYKRLKTRAATKRFARAILARRDQARQNRGV